MEKNKNARRTQENECPPNERQNQNVDKSNSNTSQGKEKSDSFKKKRKRIVPGSDASKGILGEVNGEAEK